MASSGKDRIQCLLELGEADRSGTWPDYLQYGFTETAIPALLDLVADQAFDQMDSESPEVWAPLHAWRTLGQLGSSQAIVPLLKEFDRICEDDWALPELSTVMGMLGEPAIKPLADFLHGMNLWAALTPADIAVAEECLQPVRLFATDDGFATLESMSEAEVMEQQELNEPSIRRLFQHFLAQRKQAATPFVREGKKVGRNDPCPCGSGKKFKHCCLH